MPGVDGIFVGPADLSASLGYLGAPDHPEVQAKILDAITRIRRAGKAAGILSSDEALSQSYIEAGCSFVAVGVDATLLARGTERLARRFKPSSGPAVKPGSVY